MNQPQFMQPPYFQPGCVVFARPSSPGDGNAKYYQHIVKRVTGEFAGWYAAYDNTDDDTAQYLNPLHIERVEPLQVVKNPKYKPVKESE